MDLECYLSTQSWAVSWEGYRGLHKVYGAILCTCLSLQIYEQCGEYYRGHEIRGGGQLFRIHGPGRDSSQYLGATPHEQ